MFKNNDNLLHVISAKKEMSWAAFKKAFDNLYVTEGSPNYSSLINPASLRTQTARALSWLGHFDIEFTTEGGRVFAAPPVLVRLPYAGLPQAILSGSRSPSLIKALIDICKTRRRSIQLNIFKQTEYIPFIPSRIIIQAESTEVLSEVASALEISFEETPPAWTILQFAGSLDDYIGTRLWTDSEGLNWARTVFDVSSLRFSDAQIKESLRLDRYVDPVRNIYIYYLVKGNQSAEVDGDWGQFAILQAEGLNVLIYDASQLILATPNTIPLPRLIARSLVLCSGYPPSLLPVREDLSSSFEGASFTLFKGIPLKLAEIAAAKLGQKLKFRALNHTARGLSK